jgi:hypothetical protein
MKILGDKKGLKGRLKEKVYGKRLKYLAKKSQVIQLKSQPAANLIFMSVCTSVRTKTRPSQITGWNAHKSEISVGRLSN